MAQRATAQRATAQRALAQRVLAFHPLYRSALTDLRNAAGGLFAHGEFFGQIVERVMRMSDFSTSTARERVDQTMLDGIHDFLRSPTRERLDGFLESQGMEHFNLTQEQTKGLVECVVTLVILGSVFYAKHKAEGFMPLTARLVSTLLCIYSFLLIFVVILLPLNMPEKMGGRDSILTVAMSSISHGTHYIISQLAQSFQGHADTRAVIQLFAAFNDDYIKPLQSHMLHEQIPTLRTAHRDAVSVLGETGAPFLDACFLLMYAIRVAGETFRFNPVAPFTVGLQQAGTVLASASAFSLASKAIESGDLQWLLDYIGHILPAANRCERGLHDDSAVVRNARIFVDGLFAEQGAAQENQGGIAGGALKQRSPRYERAERIRRTASVGA